jgi:hypothetical protein
MNVEQFANQNPNANLNTAETTVESTVENESKAQSLTKQSQTSEDADTGAVLPPSQSVKLQGVSTPIFSQWKLLEMVQLSDDPTDSQAGAPLQWLNLGGTDPEVQEPILIVGGFQGATNNDNRIIQLMKKAFSSGIIKPTSDIYLCPIINPSSQSKNSHLNADNADLMNSFPIDDDSAETRASLPLEVRSIMSWVEKISPKAVITLDSGENLINQSGINDELIEKISALAEREVLELGETPEIEEETEVVFNALGVALNTAAARTAEREKIHRSWKGNIGNWCAEKEIPWINFSINSDKKSFDELKEDWRLNIGPAMKWLFEGPRFNPPEEEPEIPSPTVIPTLDLPPELMNL